MLAGVWFGALIGCGSGEGSAPRPVIESAVVEVVPPTTLSPVSLPDDVVLEADDFVRLADMTEVEGLFVDNRAGRLDETVSVARGERDGPYPVGTIIQLFPTEAMVKRGAGFDPLTGDWEFFVLDVSATGTEIVTRGGADVTSGFATCVSCHGQALPESDFVCLDDPGCPDLALDPGEVRAAQLDDPRPAFHEG